LLGGFLELAGYNRGLGEAEGTGRAAQSMGIASQRVDGRRVVACDDEPLGQLGDCAELIAGPSQVFVSGTGREPEIVHGGLAHGLQDIASFFFDLMTEPAVGLCATCRWVRIVTNRRGSEFYRCLRADTDPRFVRYPPLPVLSCPGYDRIDGGAGAEPERDHDER
jgi:hypothetical protein